MIDYSLHRPRGRLIRTGRGKENMQDVCKANKWTDKKVIRLWNPETQYWEIWENGK